MLSPTRSQRSHVSLPKRRVVTPMYFRSALPTEPQMFDHSEQLEGEVQSCTLRRPRHFRRARSSRESRADDVLASDYAGEDRAGFEVAVLKIRDQRLDGLLGDNADVQVDHYVHRAVQKI